MRNLIKAFRTRPSAAVSHIDLDVIEEDDEETESDVELFKSLECVENRPKGRKTRKKVERNPKGKRAANWIPEDLSDSEHDEDNDDEGIDKPEEGNPNEIHKLCQKINKEFDSFDDFSLPVETEEEAIPMKWDERKKMLRPMTAIEMAEREDKERVREERQKQRVFEEKENRREQRKKRVAMEEEEEVEEELPTRPCTPPMQQIRIPDLRTCLRRMSEMPRRTVGTPHRRRVPREAGAVPALPRLATNNILEGLRRPHEMATPGRREPGPAVSQRRTTVAPRETLAQPLIEEEEDEEEMEDRSAPSTRSLPSCRETGSLVPPRRSTRTQPTVGGGEGRRTTRSMAKDRASLVEKEEIPVQLFSESEEEEEEQLVGIEEAHSARIEAISARRATQAAALAEPMLHSTPVKAASQEFHPSARLSRLAGVSPIRRRDSTRSAPFDDVIDDEEEEGEESKTTDASHCPTRVDERDKDEKMSVDTTEEDELVSALEQSMVLDERRPTVSDETAATLQATLMGDTVAGAGTLLYGNEENTMGAYGDGTVAVTLVEELGGDSLMMGDDALALPYTTAAATARAGSLQPQARRRTTMGNETIDVSMASVASVATQRNASMMSRRNASQITNESRFADEVPFYLHSFVGETALDQLLHVVGQDAVRGWKDQLPKDTLCNLRKLGEGTYGEVFATTMNGEKVAMKIIPFEDEAQYYDGVVNGETLKSTAEILPEILITRELSSLNNDSAAFSTSTFIPLVQCHVVKGEYPAELLKEWDAYDKRKGSENDRPSDYACPNSLFVAIGLAMGGVDVESYKVKNEKEALSALFQLALALVVAENELEFEHRDLHIGNALIAQVPEDEEIKYRLLGRDVYVKSHGVKLSIIDFTNSRLRKDGTTIFLDLEQDEELFQGHDDYQFDIYRLMREHNKGNWRDFCPKSNIYWLHYMAKELILEERKKGLARGFTKKRRKELFSVFDTLTTHDEIKAFLHSAEVYDIMQEFVRFEEAD